MAVDYKQKYLDIRAKLLESTDVAYRLGYEEGLKEGQQAAQQQAMEQQMMMEQQAAMGGMSPEEQAMMEAEGGMPPEMGGMEEGGGEEMPTEANEASELDGHIAELEGLVAKGEKPSVVAMRKAVEALSKTRKIQKSASQKKVAKVSTSQKNFVDGILKKWEKEANSKSVTEELEEVIKQHGISLED